jgi:hypothetical protein
VATAQIISFSEMPKHLPPKKNFKEENLAKENEEYFQIYYLKKEFFKIYQLCYQRTMLVGCPSFFKK